MHVTKPCCLSLYATELPVYLFCERSQSYSHLSVLKTQKSTAEVVSQIL